MVEHMTQEIMLQRMPDGSLIDWGRHVTVNGKRGHGGARVYMGEAAEVMKLVIKHSGGRPCATGSLNISASYARNTFAGGGINNPNHERKRL